METANDIIQNTSYRKGYLTALYDCLELVRFHETDYDGIMWAINDIEELIKNQRKEC